MDFTLRDEMREIDREIIGKETAVVLVAEKWTILGQC